ncbi:MAG: hypothetical protein E7161_03840 [Firmicutes bacterium]|nr:hypothetical protein [Bacillota bacterium]
MKKKVLIMYARYGSGHKAIAEYVANYLKDNNKKIEVMVLDMTDYGNWLGKVSVKIMDFVSKYRPEFIFDSAYEITDHKVPTLGHNLFSKKSYDNQRLRELIANFNPDITISSHFYCSSIINYYNEIKLINTKLFSIITDYRIHEWWIKNHKKEDGFIVGNEMVKQELVRRGVEAKKVHAFGLPLNITQIQQLDSEEEILKRYKFKGNKKVYLFFGGGTAGSMYYYDYFKTLAKINLDADVIFISGKNEKLKNKCEKYVKSKNIKNIKVLGFSYDILNIMKISDLVISKPGGATVTECLEMKVPLLSLPGLGGQEKYNAKFMVKKKFGIRVKGTWGFKRWLKKIDNNPNIIKKMHERMLKLDDNKSVEKINDLVNKL